MVSLNMTLETRNIVFILGLLAAKAAAFPLVDDLKGCSWNQVPLAIKGVQSHYFE